MIVLLALLVMVATAGCEMNAHVESRPTSPNIFDRWYIRKIRHDRAVIAVYHNRTWIDPRHCDAEALRLTMLSPTGSAFDCENDPGFSPAPIPEDAP